jgi:hypothetical protein
MGSRARQEAIASGRIVENAAAVRRRRRQEASILREELALEMYAQGATSQAISDEMFKRYQVRIVKDIPALIRRGLYRRVQDNKERVETAREMLLAHYDQLMSIYMPRALGIGEPDTDGNSPPPDPRAADLVLRILDKVGVATGALTPPKSGDINLAVIMGAPENADAARAKVMESLASERRKQLEIEGQLAGTPATLEPGEEVDDGKVMPPVPARPTQER